MFMKTYGCCKALLCLDAVCFIDIYVCGGPACEMLCFLLLAPFL